MQTSKFSHLKVLIAEDNEINKLLATRILQHWGLAYKTVHNGNEALALIEAEDFDLILMDINMPEKNGIEAAKEIRALANKEKSNIPIIALTANGLKGEEEKYIEAGMNGYLTKPFNLTELEKILDNVLSKKTEFGNRFSEMTAPKEKEKLYNLSLLEDLAQGNKDFIKSLVELFIQTTPADANAMLAAAEQNNLTQVGKLAHKLKSTIDTMQIISLKEDIRKLELYGKNNANYKEVMLLCQQTIATINTVIEQLKEDFNL
jgi:CheY-like chemotaxis protein